MQKSTAPGGPDAGDRTGRRPLVDRSRLRSTLERSTGITPQALSHLPGLIVAVLDLDFVAIEISSTVEGVSDAETQLRRDATILDGLPATEAARLRPLLQRAARGEKVDWRYDDPRGVTFETEAAPITDSFTNAVVGIVLIAHDVSDKAAAEHARAAVMQSFQDSFQLAPIPQLMLDAQGAVKAVNAAFAELLERDADELPGTPLRDLILPRDAATIDRAMRMATGGSTGARTNARHATGARLVRKSGESVHCRIHMIGLADETLGASTIVQVIDQTERDRYEAELRQVANHDSLTGLLNRRGFRERVADSLSTGRRRNEARTLLLIDIDHFKTINDLHGHAVGDTMLREVADQIRAVVDPRDPASRIAGDEFAVLCVEGPTSARSCAEALLELIRNRAAEAREAGRPPLSVSIGVAEVDSVMDSVDDVLMRADLALYEAKEWGRDCIVEASAGVVGGAARRADRVLTALRQAVTSEGFLLHAQPILELKSGKVTQHEMLARLRGDDGATLSPAEFLPVAERHGLISELDSWVLRKSVGLLGAQQAQGKSLPRLHVNMSARSVDHPEILHELAHEIRRHQVPAGHLVVELTETSKLIDLDVAQRFARQLVDLGCQLALDDFGAGFNSLIHLRELPLDYVKIDGSLTRDTATNERAAVMVEGIARTARGLGVRSVAEYVDTPACLTRLGEIGVDYAQGFQVGVPMELTASGRPARRHVATDAELGSVPEPAPMPSPTGQASSSAQLRV